jgi:hypothetical protein
MPLAGFKPTIPGIRPPQTYAVDLTATGIGRQNTLHVDKNASLWIIATQKFETGRGM